jgi:hypothetical protein
MKAQMTKVNYKKDYNIENEKRTGKETRITDPDMREEIMSARRGRVFFLEQHSAKTRDQEIVNFTTRHQ